MGHPGYDEIPTGTSNTVPGCDRCAPSRDRRHHWRLGQPLIVRSSALLFAVEEKKQKEWATLLLYYCAIKKTER